MGAYYKIRFRNKDVEMFNKKGMGYVDLEVILWRVIFI